MYISEIIYFILLNLFKFILTHVYKYMYYIIAI